MTGAWRPRNDVFGGEVGRGFCYGHSALPHHENVFGGCGALFDHRKRPCRESPCRSLCPTAVVAASLYSFDCAAALHPVFESPEIVAEVLERLAAQC